jgi:hypothetical protein
MHRQVPAELRRAIVVLAALKLKNAEIARLQRFLRNMPADELVKLLRDVEADIFSESRRDNEMESDLLADSTDDAVLQQVVRLLKTEAGMVNGDIVLALSDELRIDDERRALLKKKFEARKSFVDWLRFVNRLVGPSELLGAATRVRNRYVHSSRFPWSIEGEK